MLKGYMYNTASILMMGVGPLIAKFGLQTISASTAAFINACTIIFACYIWGHLLKRPVRFYVSKDMTILSCCNVMGVLLMYVSLSLLSPVQIGFLGRFYTVFAVLLSFFMLKENISKIEWLLVLIAVGGTFLFIAPKDSGSLSILGIICAIMYTFFFALSNVLVKQRMEKGIHSNSILFTNSMWTGALLGIYMLVFPSSWHVTQSGVSFTAIASLMTGFLGTLFLYEALKRIRFSIANIMRASSPVLLAFVSYPFFPVELTLLNIIGAAILLASIMLIGIVDFKGRRVDKGLQ
ncbi:DMT family transporter [Niallia circulans]|uniref:DMT family transporter n=1 Tax=Niallia circulans TaxID=1397 RepID=A0A553SMF8_NIACI|nr:DMT family transporter [Niallia circulans]TRZ38158.1 DMT family transporter [Niallia circulans]